MDRIKKVKRGRPKGSKNKKRRGRPIGSKNRVIKITVKHFEKVGVRCIKCKRHYTIRVDKSDYDLYTREVKKNWVCPICKVDELVEIKDINGRTITLKTRIYKKE